MQMGWLTLGVSFRSIIGIGPVVDPIKKEYVTWIHGKQRKIDLMYDEPLLDYQIQPYGSLMGTLAPVGTLGVNFKIIWGIVKQI